MLQDKRTDLEAEKRKRLLMRLLTEVGQNAPDLYYRPAAEVARLIRAHIDGPAVLHPEERALVETLSQRDIEVVLSLH